MPLPSTKTKSYSEFIASKAFTASQIGFDCGDLPDGIKEFQSAIVKWACKVGRCAIFADTGLGKTLMQLSWAEQVANKTGGRVLIVAPLCVATQTVAEGRKFGIECVYLRSPQDTHEKIQVINYEMISHFDPSEYSGIVLDESSILKGINGKVRAAITQFAGPIEYRLSCTATPSPNDTMELGTQAEFLGVMSQAEMLAMFFIHDGGETQKWRLKGHGKSRFWEWLSTWSVVIRMPSDIGYSDEGYQLPPITYYEHVIESGEKDGLFAKIAMGLQERNKARADTVAQRVSKAAEIANLIDDSCIVWCNLNRESESLAGSIENSLQVYGSMESTEKERLINAFGSGEIKKLITKPKIAGFGLNWQHCNKVIFVGLTDSWESYYQAVRRCHRFGQTRSVEVHIVSADTEGGVIANIMKKQEQHEALSIEMIEVMKESMNKNIHAYEQATEPYAPGTTINLPNWSN